MQSPVTRDSHQDSPRENIVGVGAICTVSVFLFHVVVGRWFVLRPSCGSGETKDWQDVNNQLDDLVRQGGEKEKKGKVEILLSFLFFFLGICRPFIQLLNLGLVPVEYQLFVVSTCNIPWSAYLSYAAAQQAGRAESGYRNPQFSSPDTGGLEQPLDDM